MHTSNIVDFGALLIVCVFVYLFTCFLLLFVTCFISPAYIFFIYFSFFFENRPAPFLAVCRKR